MKKSSKVVKAGVDSSLTPPVRNCAAPHSFLFLRHRRHAWPNNHAMADLSRETSRQSFSADDATSLTQFPNLCSSVSRDYDSTSQPLDDLLEGSGPSMFDDNAAVDASDPQTLSAASTDVIRSIIDHHGAVELVRRLSTMLAERDAHITALTRLAEEYKIPRGRINDTASRVKQAERRRLSLATASEDLAPSSGLGSESGVRTTLKPYISSLCLIICRSLSNQRGRQSHPRLRKGSLSFLVVARASYQKRHKSRRFLHELGSKAPYANTLCSSTPAGSRSTSR